MYEVGAVVREVVAGHRRNERRSIDVRRPDLQQVGPLGPQRIVLGEVGDQLRVGVGANRRQRPHGGGEQKLQRREPLLPIDHDELRDLTRDHRHAVEHDRAEEMRPHLRGAHLLVAEHRADVIPQQLPLMLAVPDIRPLIQRHDVADVALEQLLDGVRIRLHPVPSWRDPTSFRRTSANRRNGGLTGRHVLTGATVRALTSVLLCLPCGTLS